MPRLRLSKKYVPFGVAALVLVAVILGFVFARPSHPAPATTTPHPMGPQTDTTDQATGTPTPSAGPTSSIIPSPTSAATPPPAPTGSLLSSSKVSLSGTEESTCTTQHGVTCYIVIKNSGGTELGRILAPEVDGNGGHLVDWSVKQYISAAGQYSVSALAVQGGASTAGSSYNLEVTN